MIAGVARLIGRTRVRRPQNEDLADEKRRGGQLAAVAHLLLWRDLPADSFFLVGRTCATESCDEQLGMAGGGGKLGGTSKEERLGDLQR